MKPTKKKIALFGIILPSLVFTVYALISWAADPFGIVLTDILVKIPVMFIALKILHRVKPVERKNMPKKRVAAMLAVFAVTVCVPTQLMWHATAVVSDVSGLELFPKSLITAPILEEIVYRGLIFGISRTVFGFLPSLVVSAFWFQQGHLTLDYAVITIPVSISTAVLYELTGNLKYNVLMHSVFNFISFFFAFVNVPMFIALPIYALSLALLIAAVIKRDSLGKELRISSDREHLSSE